MHNLFGGIFRQWRILIDTIADRVESFACRNAKFAVSFPYCVKVLHALRCGEKLAGEKKSGLDDFKDVGGAISPMLFTEDRMNVASERGDHI